MSPSLRRLLPLTAVGSLAAATALAAGPVASAATTTAAPFVLEEATIAQIESALAGGRTSCTKIVDGYLARIAAYEDSGPALNSLITVAADARAQAARLDAAYARGGPVGALHCVPMVLKDNVDTTDMQTTAGSKTLAGSVPTQDATLTTKLRAAGAIVLAKGNLDEWAHGGMAGYSSVNGQTYNPYDKSRSTSGSSAGPAAAVAANLAESGIGTDTLGSIRGPADAESLAAVKPTLGLVSGAGVVPFALTFDVAGPLTRTVADSAAILDVIAGVDPQDPRTSAAAGKVVSYSAGLRTDALKGVRIGVLRNLVNARATPVVDAAIATMRNLGATVVEVTAPDSVNTLTSQYYTTISQYEFKTQLGQYLQSRRPAAPVQTHADVLAASSQPGFGIAPSVLARLQAEDKRGPLSDPEYQSALAAGPRAMRDVVDGMLRDNNVTALLHPSSTASGMASLSGYPAALVPGGNDANGISLGIALQGTGFTEDKLLAYAYAYEQAAKARELPALTPPLASPSATPTATPTVTMTPSASPTVTMTPSASPTATPTVSMTPSASPTATMSPAGVCNVPATVELGAATIIATGSAPVTVRGPAGSTVDVFAYTRPSSTFRVVRTGTVGADGTVSLTAVRPPANTRLYAQVRGCTADVAADSVVLNVRTALSLFTTRNGPRDYTFTGDSLPARPGGLIVSLYRVTAQGRQVLTSQVRASPSNGQWTIQRMFTGTGRFGFVVRTGQDLRNAPGTSNIRSALIS